jgi:hypothetical protein
MSRPSCGNRVCDVKLHAGELALGLQRIKTRVLGIRLKWCDSLAIDVKRGFVIDAVEVNPNTLVIIRKRQLKLGAPPVRIICTAVCVCVCVMLK